MSAFATDFLIDGMTGVCGEFTGDFVARCIDGGEIVVDKTYRARNFLKFVNEVYKRHKNDYGKKSPIDMSMMFVNHPIVGEIFVVKIGDCSYGLCPTKSDTGVECDD